MVIEGRLAIDELAANSSTDEVVDNGSATAGVATTTGRDGLPNWMTGEQRGDP